MGVNPKLKGPLSSNPEMSAIGLAGGGAARVQRVQEDLADVGLPVSRACRWLSAILAAITLAARLAGHLVL